MHAIADIYLNQCRAAALCNCPIAHLLQLSGKYLNIAFAGLTEFINELDANFYSRWEFAFMCCVFSLFTRGLQSSTLQDVHHIPRYIANSISDVNHLFMSSAYHAQFQLNLLKIEGPCAAKYCIKIMLHSKNDIRNAMMEYYMNVDKLISQRNQVVCKL